MKINAYSQPHSQKLSFNISIISQSVGFLQQIQWYEICSNDCRTTARTSPSCALDKGPKAHSEELKSGYLTMSRRNASALSLYFTVLLPQKTVKLHSIVLARCR